MDAPRKPEHPIVSGQKRLGPGFLGTTSRLTPYPFDPTTQAIVLGEMHE